MDSLVGIAAGAFAAVVVTLVSAVASRRWGLPGLGRDIQTQQASLISTLKDEVAELRAQRVSDERRIKALEGCADELARLRADMIELYRRQGSRPPVHLEDAGRG